MTARIVLVAILVTAVVAGAAIYWLQEYAFYRELSPAANEGFEFTLRDGSTEVLPAAGFQGIDSNSSPIRYRACFTIPADRVADLAPFPLAEPLNPPRWFSCFDAPAIGHDLLSGEAQAVLGEPVVEGVVRVAAVYPDGRAFAWHQIDPCGPLVDEDERPTACPEPPAVLPASGEAAAVDPPVAVPPAEPPAEPGTP